MFERWYPREPRERRTIPAITRVLKRYFGGDISAIDDVAVEPNGTVFQKDVWKALRRIPAGGTVVRGAGQADWPRRGRSCRRRGNGANPVAIVVPCHRVIGSDGSLTGYGGGLDRKRWLLAHEGVVERASLLRRQRVNSRRLTRTTSLHQRQNRIMPALPFSEESVAALLDPLWKPRCDGWVRGLVGRDRRHPGGPVGGRARHRNSEFWSCVLTEFTDFVCSESSRYAACEPNGMISARAEQRWP